MAPNESFHVFNLPEAVGDGDMQHASIHRQSQKTTYLTMTFPFPTSQAFNLNRFKHSNHRDLLNYSVHLHSIVI
jgi:hypothetical protein